MLDLSVCLECVLFIKSTRCLVYGVSLGILQICEALSSQGDSTTYLVDASHYFTQLQASC